MAAVYKLPSGLWRAQVNRRGVRKSQAFPLKAAAVAWAGRVENEVMAGVRGEIPNLTVKELLDKYLEEVTPTKKGHRWESIRIELLKQDKIAAVRLRVLDTPHVSEWQVRRGKQVSGASVRRERNILSNAFQIAMDEWKWLQKNPFKGVRRTKEGKPRTRIATDEEISTLLAAATPNLSRAISAALETGMRAGEIASRPEIRGRIAFLVDSKNGEAREVPLSAKALEVFMEGITLTAGSISTEFAQLTKACGIKGLRFHDLRRTAITRIAKKLNAFELSKMVGHKDLKMTLNVYYKQDTEETARKL